MGKQFHGNAAESRRWKGRLFILFATWSPQKMRMSRPKWPQSFSPVFCRVFVWFFAGFFAKHLPQIWDPPPPATNQFNARCKVLEKRYQNIAVLFTTNWIPSLTFCSKYQEYFPTSWCNTFIGCLPPPSRPNHVHQDQMHGSTYHLSLSAEMYQAMTAQHAYTLPWKPNLVSNGHDNNDCMAHACQLGWRRNHTWTTRCCFDCCYYFRKKYCRYTCAGAIQLCIYIYTHI